MLLAGRLEPRVVAIEELARTVVYPTFGPPRPSTAALVHLLEVHVVSWVPYT